MSAVRFGQEFLQRDHEKPFFLAVGLWHPHIPLFAPQKYFDLYPPEEVRLPEVPDNDLDDLPPGFLPVIDRNTVRIGMTLWLPVFGQVERTQRPTVPRN